MNKQKCNLAARTYEQLLEAICSGHLRPGERLNQDDLAATMEVSRQPVNQAISLLKAQHFLLDTGKRGVIVAPVDEQHFKAIYEFRTVAEPLATKLAAEGLTDEARNHGEAIIAKGKSLAGSDDHVAHLRMDMLFHDWLYTLCGNELVAASMRINWRHMQRSMGAVLRQPGELERIWTEHEGIFLAICRNEPDTAAAIMREHMTKSVYQ